jgi:hypothetical protein
MLHSSYINGLLAGYWWVIPGLLQDSPWQFWQHLAIFQLIIQLLHLATPGNLAKEGKKNGKRI